MRTFLYPILVLTVLVGSRADADGPDDNIPTQVRSVPPKGIELDKATTNGLLRRAAAIDDQLSEIADLDVLSTSAIAVFPRAVRMTIATEMFYSEKELRNAEALLDEAERRLKLAQAGVRKNGLFDDKLDMDGEEPRLVASGFQSRIDGSIQPLGVVLPTGWDAASDSPLRLDVWLHGRGERVSEVGFLTQRMRDAGQYTPPGTIVLHPYGRYCNAFKFAGEIDVLEAIEAAKRLFNIDDSRITIRGFSMGGAGCWQLAVHYPNLWAAANPGAGFSETIEFLRFFQQEEFLPTKSQRSLLHWYDCPDWANNLRAVPTVAYSGEIDKQKQAADIMAAAFESRDMQLTHIIGPQTAHKIHPDSKLKIEALLGATLAQGKEPCPKNIDLTTYTLRYHELGWLSIEGLAEHWRESRVKGRLADQEIELETSRVTRIKLTFDSNAPFEKDRPLQVKIDGTTLSLPAPSETVNSYTLVRETAASPWEFVKAAATKELRKKPGLQGPIDDAFMSAFLFVPPEPRVLGENVGKAPVEQWALSEYQHATREWVRHFRGDLVSLPVREVTEEHMRQRNLILFGTPKSNPLIAKIMDSLPIQWQDKTIKVGGETFDASTHAPVLIYPNPLNPERYVVINSGFTYREFAYLNNARQIPMLPDWAVVDVSEGATTQFPGKVLEAGFFDESWRLKEKE